MSSITNDLGLSDKNSEAGCACCAAPEQKDAAPAPAGLVSTDLGVTGMTCGHCVSSVTEELSALEGVQSVDVTLNVGGVSAVTVSSTSALDQAAIRAAVDGAGYSLAEV